ncbi:MAG: tripartite tricarboxylate transporter substrate binding protein [Rhodospirillales bacterium]|nr:tripartite tricarboxylate transporter substrate binding protein [Rhodospirillales bacterium]
MNITRRSLMPLAVGAATALSTPGLAQAAAFPTRPMRLVVPYPPGGSADLIGRMVADAMGHSFSQSVIVENKGGASGAIGTAYAAHARADGYTFLMAIADTLAIDPAVFAHLPYDPRKDFDPISLLAVQPFVLAVGPAVKAPTLAALMAEAKTKPNTISFASNGAGGLQHLAIELLAAAAGVKLLHVPYTGAGPALSDVMGGHVDGIFISLQAGGSALKAGKLRALAITSQKRLSIAPNVPTFAELGYKNFNVQQWYGLVAPHGTPAPVIAALNARSVAAIKSPAIAGKLEAAGTEPVGSTPAAFGAFLDKQIALWAGVAKANHIRIE